MSDDTNIRLHWSFWVVAAVTLLFNLAGCFNFVFQMDPDNVASMPDMYRTIIENRPAWGTAAFGVAVFGGALGCLFLLLRKSIAIYVFVLALAGTVAAQIPDLAIDNLPFEARIGWLTQLLMAVFLIWYSRRARSRGWIS